MKTNLKSTVLYPTGWQMNLLRMLLALSLLAASLALAVRPALAQTSTEGTEGSTEVYCITYHKVQRGETLYKIGLKYGMTWKRIAEANKLANPNKIYAGQTLCIPGEASTEGNQYVRVIKADVNIRKGPGMGYGIIAILRGGQTALVTGKSSDGNWWRIICPDGKVGECYVTANPRYTELVVLDPVTEPDDEEKIIPTFSIKAVVRNSTVTITTADFPKNTEFVVRMGRYGTQGVNGVIVAEVDSGKGGKQSFTFNIPVSLVDRGRIAIRMESESGYYAYNWFYNVTTK